VVKNYMSNADLQHKGVIFNIQKYSIYDGPGVRTLIFLKGCPLKCKWCANPEGISPTFQVMFSKSLCTSCRKCIPVCQEGIFSTAQSINGETQLAINRDIPCTGCGACVDICPERALRVAGQEKTIEEIVDIVMQDSIFYYNSGGGVTMGGGEPTRQPKFLAAILEECYKQGIHTAIETCGYTNWKVYERILPFTKLFLFDLKSMDSKVHKELTGVPNEKIHSNLEQLFLHNANVIVRIPLIVDQNDSLENLEATMNFVKQVSSKSGKLLGVEVLPYHKLGVNKYHQLGKPYILSDELRFTPDRLQEIESFLEKFQLPIRIVKH
jgi:pyruvate formate lyase activating enzyme